jgi:hypothetical protein
MRFPVAGWIYASMAALLVVACCVLYLAGRTS